MPDLQNVKFAIANGEIDELKKSLETMKEKDNKSALLITAADYGQKEAIELLIKSGADVNYKDNHEITPLLCAIFEDHVEAAECLIRHGADTKLTTPDGNSYASAATSENMKKLLNVS